MIMLKVTKNQGFILSLEDEFFEKPQMGGGDGGSVSDPNRLPPPSLPAVLGLSCAR